VDGLYYIRHVHADRTTPRGVERTLQSFAASDGRDVAVRIEQEGAASGKIVAYHFERMLDGYDARFTGVPRSAKAVRAGPFSAACERGDVVIVNGPWVDEFLDELTAFPGVAHDDRVDAAVGAYEGLQSRAEFAEGGFVLTAGNN
jgi:predicted phage terminase large subunit-like protein